MWNLQPIWNIIVKIGTMAAKRFSGASSNPPCRIIVIAYVSAGKRHMWIYIRSRSIKEKKAKILVAIVEFYITAMPLDLVVNVKRSEHTELN